MSIVASALRMTQHSHPVVASYVFKIIWCQDLTFHILFVQIGQSIVVVDVMLKKLQNINLFFDVPNHPIYPKTTQKKK